MGNSEIVKIRVEKLYPAPGQSEKKYRGCNGAGGVDKEKWSYAEFDGCSDQCAG